MTKINYTDLDGLNTVGAVGDEIIRVLKILRDSVKVLSEEDMSDRSILLWYADQTKFLQPYYSKLERLV